VASSNVNNVAITCTSPQSLMTLASGQPNPAAIVVDSANVYWSTEPPSGNNNGILKVPVGGGTPAVFLFPSFSIALALDLNNVYFTTGSAVWLEPKSGGNQTQLASGVQVPLSSTTFLPIFGLAVDAQNAYMTSTNLGEVVRIPLIGNPATPSAVTPYVSGTLPQAVAVDATTVYWTYLCQTASTGGCTSGGVSSAPRLGGPVTSIATGQTYPAGIAVDATYVYWTDNAAGTVMKAPLAGGASITIASGQNYPYGIAIDNTNVYWTNNGGTVMKAPLAGGTPITIASGQGYPVGIAVDATSVYWTNYTAGTVMKQTPK